MEVQRYVDENVCQEYTVVQMDDSVHCEDRLDCGFDNNKQILKNILDRSRFFIHTALPLITTKCSHTWCNIYQFVIHIACINFSKDVFQIYIAYCITLHIFGEINGKSADCFHEHFIYRTWHGFGEFKRKSADCFHEHFIYRAFIHSFQIINPPPFQ